MKLNIEIEFEESHLNPVEFKRSLAFLTDERDEAFRNSFECEHLIRAVKSLIDCAERNVIYDSEDFSYEEKKRLLEKKPPVVIRKMVVSKGGRG